MPASLPRGGWSALPASTLILLLNLAACGASSPSAPASLPEAAPADARLAPLPLAAAHVERAYSGALRDASADRTPIPAGAVASLTPAAPLPAPAALRRDVLEHIAAHCYIERFAHDIHQIEAFQARGLVPADQKRPRLPATPPRPRPDDDDYPAYVQGLQDDWTAHPGSHVLDCEITLTPRDCDICKPHSRRTFRYGLYLPARYLQDPDSVRTVLLLTPGGKGGRTRWFLDPVPYKYNPEHQTQGLSLQRRLDDLLAASPELSPPLVVTMDDPGQPYTNGIYAWLTEDLLQHVLTTYLPGKTREDVAFGIDAISSGSKNAAIAFIHRPDAFDTFGWMCNHCDDNGFNPDLYFRRPNGPGQRALKRWAERAQRGELAMKFSIGKRDPYLVCNQGMYDRLVDAGVIQPTFEPYLTGCAEGVDPKDPDLTDAQRNTCITHRTDMTEYPGVGHSYALMPVAFDDHIQWHLQQLTEIARLR